ncbi:hypothetical protein LJB89_01710 [Tyzzerella sp. OttesenSCG-928-J15]|nr:hypothetical protein [Ruminococcaceae bacterium OttesenSCG-928-L11]MDL2248395.1 hypothetical protein [Tyzzerella sp. OttesenSCG-928-J15]MDL2300406.1 hypothetical protein [Clostridiaceae bacterium OttesenSCG-928-D20]
MLGDEKITALYFCLRDYNVSAINIRANYLLDFAQEQECENIMLFMDIGQDEESPFCPERLRILSGLLHEDIGTVVMLKPNSFRIDWTEDNLDRYDAEGVSFISIPYDTAREDEPDYLYDFRAELEIEKDAPKF